MNIVDAISFLKERVPEPEKGLPDELFYFVSEIIPMVNVDLLIKDEKGRTLLAWRDDRYSGRGWHLPGGIIRFKEKIGTRINKVAESEIGTAVEFDRDPIVINQIIVPERKIRGHFISLLYRCFLRSSFVPANIGLSPTDPGYLKWHDACPDDLLEYHEVYREYLA